MTMVAYQKFVSIVFDVARDRGRSIDSLSDSQQYLGVAAELWTENKATLRGMDEAEARRWTEQNA